MINVVKNISVQILTKPMVRWIFNPFSKELAIIFMMHRFNDAGHDPKFLDKALNWLRSEGFVFESLDKFLNTREACDSHSLKKVIFTLDDGYHDQLSIAAPIFYRHSCPATVFLITDFIDGRCWPWDDKIEFILKNTKRDEINFAIKGKNISLDLVNHNIDVVVHQVREFCKKNPGSQLGEFIEVLSREARVGLPGEAPREYLPLSWDMVHEWEQKGISFGSHGRDHIVLSTLQDDEVSAQLETSLKRIKEEVEQPVTAFCYPTGRFGRDFGPREVQQVKNLEYDAGISSDNGYAHMNALDEDERYRVMRFAFPGSMQDLIQYCSGFELFKDRVRQLAGLVK